MPNIAIELPSGGIDDVLRALSAHDSTMPLAVYERLDPINRDPLTTWIALGGTFRDVGDRPFDTLRDEYQQGRQSDESLLFVQFGFPEDRSASNPVDHLLVVDEYLRVDHGSATAWLVRPTGDASETDARKRLLESLWRHVVEPTIPKAESVGLRSTDWVPVVTLAEFSATVDSAKARSSGATHGGAVLSVPLKTRNIAAALPSYRRLRVALPSTCMFLLRAPDLNLWGATSLSLLEVHDRHLLAVTDGATVRLPESETPASFAWRPNAKELSEYDVVAEALWDDLVPVTAPGTLRFTKEREPRFFGSLGHLFGEAQATIADGVDEIALVEALFPHGATVGFPRREATRLIRELEPEPRGPFAGFLGVFLGDGGVDIATVTRSMWTTSEGTVTQAGAKIVEESVASDEYQECIMKTSPVRNTAVWS